MAALKFAKTQNLVAFLEKPKESDGFAQIATAKAKTVNGEVQLQALVDGKKVIITETRYKKPSQKLTFYKALFSPQWKFLIHTILQCLSAKTTAWNKFSSTMASVIICLATNNKFNFSKYIFEKEGEGSTMPTDPQHTPTISQPSTSQPQKKQPRRKQRKDTEDPQLSGPTEPVTNDTENVASVPTHSNDPLLSGNDRLKLNELMELCTSLSQRVLALETTKTNQALEIDSLKRRVKKLEKKKGSRTHRLKRLFKVGRSAQVVSSEDEGLGAQEDASKQGRKTVDLDADAEEVEVEKVVSTVEVSTVSATTTTVDELTLAQTLIEIKAAKPKVVTTTTTTTTTAVTRPKARGVAKDKSKAKMIEPKKPLKRKDQIMIDEEIALNLQAQLQDELEEEERLLMDKRKKHFTRLRVEEQRRKPPTKAQKRNTMSTYLKNMAEYKHNQLKTKSFEDIQMLFDKAMTRVNTFVDIDISRLVNAKLDENVEAKVDDDQEEAEMKKHMEIVPDDEVAIDVISLATKPLIIVDWKIIKEGKMGYFQIIRADRSSMGGVHFVRFQNLHIFMLVEKRYPLTPATITEMLNKKLQADHWNEMCYQLLKLMTKQLKNPGSV
ncbi:hypothetical protein Tco_0446820 [Tanacetum coccineum]